MYVCMYGSPGPAGGYGVTAGGYGAVVGGYGVVGGYAACGAKPALGGTSACCVGYGTAVFVV